MRAGNHMPEMAAHRVDEKKFAVFVPIITPRIYCAAGQHFENLFGGMIAPDSASNRNAMVRQGPGRADLAGRRGAAPSVQPSIRSPAEPVGDGMMAGGGHSESVQN